MHVGGLVGGDGLEHSRVFFGGVRLPQEELVQQGVDRLWALHHYHVAAFLYDFQEGEQKDLKHNR